MESDLHDHAAITRPHQDGYWTHYTRRRTSPAERLPELLAAYRQADGDLDPVLHRYSLANHPGGGPQEPDCECGDCLHPADPVQWHPDLDWAYFLTPDGIHVSSSADLHRSRTDDRDNWSREEHDQYAVFMDLPEPEAPLSNGVLVPWTTDPAQDFGAPVPSWRLGDPVKVADTIEYRADGVTYAFRVPVGSRAEQLLLGLNYVPSGHGDQPARPGAAAVRGYQLPPGTPWWVAQNDREATRLLEQFAEPVLTVHHDAVRRHRHSEDLGLVLPKPTGRRQHRPEALSGIEQLHQDVHIRKAAILARKDGRYGEVELLALYADTGLLVSTYTEPPSRHTAVGPCQDPTWARAAFGLDTPGGIPQPPPNLFDGARVPPASPDGLYQDIATGALVVHARHRAPDGTLMALATYRFSRRAVHLYGEGEHRHIADRFEDTTQARTAWNTALGITDAARTARESGPPPSVQAARLSHLPARTHGTDHAQGIQARPAAGTAAAAAVDPTHLRRRSR